MWSVLTKTNQPKGKAMAVVIGIKRNSKLKLISGCKVFQDQRKTTNEFDETRDFTNHVAMQKASRIVRRRMRDHEKTVNKV